MNNVNCKTIITSKARPSCCVETEGALDVDVTIRFADGTELEGELTLLPAEDGSGYTSWGSPSHWVSDGLLSVIQCRDDFDLVLDMLAASASAACDAYEDHLVFLDEITPP